MSIVRISASDQSENQAERPSGDRDPEGAPQRDGRERAHREDVAVGEVDQLDDPVDERVADCDQRPDGAVREPLQDVEAQLGKIVVDDRVSVEQPDLIPADEVVQAVVDRQRQQCDDQAPGPHTGPQEVQGPGGAAAHRFECCDWGHGFAREQGGASASRARPATVRPTQTQEALRYFVGCSVL